MTELNRRATLGALAGITGSATVLAPPTTAESDKQTNQSQGRPDIQIINNQNEAVDLSTQFTLDGNVVQKVDLQLAPNESRTISEVLLPKAGVYSVELLMDGKTVDSSHAEAPDSSFPPYLSVHMDLRENDAFVTTSEV